MEATGDYAQNPLARGQKVQWRFYAIQPTSPLQHALLRANSDSLAHNVGMLLDKRSSHRPPQNQGKKPREDFNQAAVRIVEEAAEKH